MLASMHQLVVDQLWKNTLLQANLRGRQIYTYCNNSDYMGISPILHFWELIVYVKFRNISPISAKHGENYGTIMYVRIFIYLYVSVTVYFLGEFP